MTMYLEIVFWVLGIVIGFILGWFTNWHFYKKQRDEGKSAIEILKQLQQFNDTVVRLGKDRRGKIIRNENGTYGIAWEIVLKE
jgi:hypothetical protein